MANFSSTFPVKKHLAKFVILLLCLVILLQVYLSLYLSRASLKILRQVKEDLGKIYITGASFDLWYGFSLNNVAVIDSSTPPRILFKSDKLSFGFPALDLLRKKININKIKCLNGVVYADKNSHIFDKLSAITKAAYEEFLKNQLIPMEVKIIDPAYIVKDSKIIFVDSEKRQDEYWILKLQSYTSLKTDKISTKGSGSLEYKFSKNSSLANFFNDQIFSQKFDYQAGANFTRKDLVIDNFDLLLGYDHIRGQAIIKNFDSKLPLLNLVVNSSNLSIENITSLVKDFNTRGTFNISAIVRGPLDSLKFIVAFNLLGCSFHYAQMAPLRNIVGKIHWTQDKLVIDELFCIIKDVALEIKGEFSRIKDAIRLYANLNLKEVGKASVYFPRAAEINFSGREEEAALHGDLELKLQGQDNNLYRFNLEEIKVSGKKTGGSFSAKGLQFSLQPLASQEQPLDNKLKFYDLTANFFTKDKEFMAQDIKAQGLNGSLDADLLMYFSPNFRYRLLLRAANLDAAQIQEGLKLPYNLLGSIYARVFIDSQPRDCLEGALMIKDGKLQDTAMLISLAEYMKIASLRAIDFANLQINFSFLKDGGFKYGVKSEGKDVILKANIHINKDNQLFSYSSAKLSQAVLVQSAQFRRLLNIVGEQSNYVEFPFIIAGTIHKPRLQWLRNDFKRALENAIPAWYRKGIQREIDEVVEEMPEGGN